MRELLRDDELWVIHGDALEVVTQLPAASVDAVVTDPPYGIAFMHNKWDSMTPAGYQRFCEEWAGACLRALKPGGHLLAFGGTRTYHRLACGIEDAGFEIRDSLAWLYAQGFPKSRNLGGGWGTALKPAYEPIVVARAPFKGSVDQNHRYHGTGGLHVQANVIATAGGSPAADRRASARASGATPGRHADRRDDQRVGFGYRGSDEVYMADREIEQLGRWPANVLLEHHADCQRVGVREVASDGHYPADRGPGGLSTDGHAGQSGLDEAHTSGELVEDWLCAPGCPVGQLDAQSGARGAASPVLGTEASKPTSGIYGEMRRVAGAFHADQGGASRFFFCAKASKAEREEGLDHLPRRFAPTMGNGIGEREHDPADEDAYRRNIHPTVKPVDAMRWLVRLVCRRGGVVLDPFMGSATTGIACLREEARFIGVEQDDDYIDIAVARLRHHQVRNLTLEV